MEEFLKDLYRVLERHNGSINWNCSEGSDTHGVYDSHLEIAIGRKTVRLDGHFMTKNGIKDLLDNDIKDLLLDVPGGFG